MVLRPADGRVLIKVETDLLCLPTDVDLLLKYSLWHRSMFSTDIMQVRSIVSPHLLSADTRRNYRAPYHKESAGIFRTFASG